MVLYVNLEQEPTLPQGKVNSKTTTFYSHFLVSPRYNYVSSTSQNYWGKNVITVYLKSMHGCAILAFMLVYISANFDTFGKFAYVLLQ